MKVILAVLIALVSTTAMAESLTWHFKNNHESIVDFELYADNGKWPGKGSVYSLDDGSTRNVTISCDRGEKICYGAWVRGTESSSWGAGKGGQESCKSCCYICGTGETPVLTFE